MGSKNGCEEEEEKEEKEEKDGKVGQWVECFWGHAVNGDMGTGCESFLEFVTEGVPGGRIASQTSNIYTSLLFNAHDVGGSGVVQVVLDVGTGLNELVTEGVPGGRITHQTNLLVTLLFNACDVDGSGGVQVFHDVGVVGFK